MEPVIYPVLRPVNTGIGIPFAKRRGGLSASLIAKLLFWGRYSEIADNKMPNMVGDDWLTVSGEAGSETYQCPDTSGYILADTDYVWYQKNEVRRTVTTAELIGYDFPRTLIKYDSTSPYQIREIAILKSGETLTASEIDNIHSYFQLSLWWNGVLNLNGYLKENKPLAQKYTWTPDFLWGAEIEVYNDNLTTKLSASYLNKLNVLVAGLKSDLSITNLSDYFDQILIYANETSEAALKNLVANTNHATNQGTTFIQYEGLTGDGIETYIDTGYNPNGFPGNYKQNDGAFGLYIRNDVYKIASSPTSGSVSVGSIKIGLAPWRDISYRTRTWVNQYTELISTTGATSKGFWFGNRTGANDVSAWHNKDKTSATDNASSSSILNGNLYDCALNFNGSPGNFVAHQVAIRIVMKSMTDEQQGKIVDRFEAYMDSNGKGVIS